MRKVGIQDLTIQSSQLHVFEWKNVKRKGNEKSRNPKIHPLQLNFATVSKGKFGILRGLKRKGKKPHF